LTHLYGRFQSIGRPAIEEVGVPSSVAPVDVTVVGAGPTGLLLAGDLAAAGVSCRVLERRRQTEENLSRAFAVHTRTLEILDCRGLAGEVLATGSRAVGLRVFSTVDIDLARLQGRTRFPSCSAPAPDVTCASNTVWSATGRAYPKHEGGQNARSFGRP
jgi:choline dehydrogenase-like flavoprotein